MNRFFVVIIVILVVMLGFHLAKTQFGLGLSADVPENPVETVNEFMETGVVFSKLYWDEKTRETLKKELEMLKNKKESPGFYEHYNIKNPMRLFVNKKYGQAAIAVLALYKFDSFALAENENTGNKVEVTSSFLPEDFMGLKSVVRKKAGFETPMEGKTITMPFTVIKISKRWYIDSIGGTTGKLIKNIYKMNRFRKKK